MLRLIILAFSICIMALGSSYAAILFSTQPKTIASPDSLLSGLDYVKTPTFSVPIIRSEGLIGYMLVKIVFTIEAKRLGQLAVTPEPVVVDTAFRFIYADTATDISDMEKFDYEGFAAMLIDKTNAWYKEDLIEEVIIEQMDFLSLNEISQGARRE